MMTWKLFTTMFWGWGASDNAIFVYDASRDPGWQSTLRRITRFRAAWLLGSLVFVIVGILFVRDVLFFFIPPLAIFALALALILGPVVVIERMKSRWEALLLVPYDVRAILLGKVGGALWHIRLLTHAIGILLMCASAIVGITSLALIPSSATQTSGWYTVGISVILFIVPILGSLLFIFDRMQYYTLLAVAALASGTVSHSIRAALLTATATILLIWLAEIAAGEALLTLEEGTAWRLQGTRILSLATLGPAASYTFRVESGYAVLFIAGTLLLREALIVGFWRWTLHSARQCSGIESDR